MWHIALGLVLAALLGAIAFAQTPPPSVEQQTSIDWNALQGSLTAMQGTVDHLRDDIQRMMQELRAAKAPPVLPQTGTKH